MQRREVEAVKTEAERLLDAIKVMERTAGWVRYTNTETHTGATSKPHPDDIFNSGQYTATVRRASMDLTRALVALRRG